MFAQLDGLVVEPGLACLGEILQLEIERAQRFATAQYGAQHGVCVGVVLGEQEGFAHGDRLRQAERFDMQETVELDVVFLIGAWKRFPRKYGADIAAFQIQVVLAGIARIQGIFETVQINGQRSHGRDCFLGLRASDPPAAIVCIAFIGTGSHSDEMPLKRPCLPQKSLRTAAPAGR